MRVGVYFVASGPLVASPPLIAKPSVRPLRWSDTAEKRRLFPQLFLDLCLSGACLGKVIVCINVKMAPKKRFPHRKGAL